MTSSDLTPEQWKTLEARVMQQWKAAYDLCQHVVDADFPVHDPMYQLTGALLGAACDLRRLVTAGIEGQPLPKPDGVRSMMTFVQPHAGGGCVPQKLKR